MESPQNRGENKTAVRARVPRPLRGRQRREAAGEEGKQALGVTAGEEGVREEGQAPGVRRRED